MVKHSSTIITLTTAITTYYLAVKATDFYETKLRNAKLLNIATDKIAETWSKIRLASTLALSAAKFALSGNIKMATTAMRAFNTATKGNLIALVASAVIAAHRVASILLYGYCMYKVCGQNQYEWFRCPS